MIALQSCMFLKIFKVMCNKAPYKQNDDYELIIFTIPHLNYKNYNLFIMEKLLIKTASQIKIEDKLIFNRFS